ncbi:hypothetical protein [Paenibacillus elgii]|uniref:hypothetical protein n=1 Tax=Paenibacillus elgii TaxID=189691 RepID=UPI00203B0AE3|nr:hypothetical protein [Paenibacillus elgii]MCM3271132.1 hypothetical protein [Paenibacillus elgii]
MEDLKTLISLLSFILAASKFVLDEWRLKQKIKKEREEKRKQREDEAKEKGAYPPRKDKHQR